MSIWFEPVPSIKSLNAKQVNTLAEHLDMKITRITDNSLIMSMPVDSRTTQPHGRLHGGASVALAETVGSIAANLALDTNLQAGVGLEINANHIRPIKEGVVFATATAEALGRTTQVWSIRITDSDDRLICISRFTVAVISAVRA